MKILKLSKENCKIKIDVNTIFANLKFFNKKTETNYIKNIEKIILQELQKFYRIANPKAFYAIEGKVACEYLYFESFDVKNLLEKADKIAIFAVSLGKEIDDKIENFLHKDVFRALIWDAMGNVAVEELANFLNNYIKDKALLMDFLLTKRYSCGYGDWKIEENFKFYKALDLEKEGFEITKYGLIIPKKTITSILGLIKR